MNTPTTNPWNLIDLLAMLKYSILVIKNSSRTFYSFQPLKPHWIACLKYGILYVPSGSENFAYPNIDLQWIELQIFCWPNKLVCSISVIRNFFYFCVQILNISYSSRVSPSVSLHYFRKHSNFKSTKALQSHILFNSLVWTRQEEWTRKNKHVTLWPW